MCIYISISIYLPSCLSIYLSVYQSIYLSIVSSPLISSNPILSWFCSSCSTSNNVVSGQFRWLSDIVLQRQIRISTKAQPPVACQSLRPRPREKWDASCDPLQSNSNRSAHIDYTIHDYIDDRWWLYNICTADDFWFYIAVCKSPCCLNQSLFQGQMILSAQAPKVFGIPGKCAKVWVVRCPWRSRWIS